MRKRRIGTAKFFTLLLLLYHTSAKVHEAKQESTETLRGDINDSGSVDINDAQLFYSLLSKGAADERYDVNGDGAVDQTDLDALMDMILNPKSAEGGNKV